MSWSSVGCGESDDGVPGGEYPDGLEYDAASHETFVSDEAGGADLVISTQANWLVATIPLGAEAGNTQFDPDSGRIYVGVQTRNELATGSPHAAAPPTSLQFVPAHGIMQPWLQEPAQAIMQLLIFLPARRAIYE